MDVSPTVMRYRWILAAAVLIGAFHECAAARNALDPEIHTVFSNALVEMNPELTEVSQQGSYTVRDGGRILEATVELPRLPVNQRDARRIVVNLVVEPVLVGSGDKLRPGDPWTRLGSVSIINRAGNAATPAPEAVEIMRFITGFGGRSEYTQDITALAPLLDGRTTFRLSISTFNQPGWKVSLNLLYSLEDAGFRRPVFAAGIFHNRTVTAAHSTLRSVVQVPRGMAQPRIHIISTGHSSDGEGGDEFVTRTHVLKVDGVEIARWRPWAETGGTQRKRNPTSGRVTIDGRELWSSDLDRSGWHPGLRVEPLAIPVPELTPGRHIIELTILDIREKDDSGHGYWRTSAVVVADETWPESPGR